MLVVVQERGITVHVRQRTGLGQHFKRILREKTPPCLTHTTKLGPQASRTHQLHRLAQRRYATHPAPDGRQHRYPHTRWSSSRRPSSTLPIHPVRLNHVLWPHQATEIFEHLIASMISTIANWTGPEMRDQDDFHSTHLALDHPGGVNAPCMASSGISPELSTPLSEVSAQCIAGIWNTPSCSFSPMPITWK